MFYRCTSESCKFEFHSGYSYDLGWSAALCLQCDARYCLPKLNVEGLIEVRRLICEPVKHRGRKKHIPRCREVYEPTGQFVIAEISPDASSTNWLSYIGVDELECAACKATGQIATDLCAGDACPRCKTGKVEREDGVIYY